MICTNLSYDFGNPHPSGLKQRHLYKVIFKSIKLLDSFQAVSVLKRDPCKLHLL